MEQKTAGTIKSSTDALFKWKFLDTIGFSLGQPDFFLGQPDPCWDNRIPAGAIKFLLGQPNSCCFNQNSTFKCATRFSTPKCTKEMFHLLLQPPPSLSTAWEPYSPTCFCWTWSLEPNIWCRLLEPAMVLSVILIVPLLSSVHYFTEDVTLHHPSVHYFPEDVTLHQHFHWTCH